MATALANGVMLEPGCLLPRRLQIEGVDYIIENGVGRDMVSNGIIEVHGGTITYESLRLTQQGYHYVVSTFGRGMLMDAGLLSPD